MSSDYDIDTIINRKKEIFAEISVHQKKLIILENELLKIEHMMASFSEINIADSLSLSEQQKQIVESTDKNILVVACPGSGKTHTLISRYINLVTKEKVDPSRIILITFTKKAGMEMNQRISNIIPHKLPYYVGSLHGLGFRLLQEYHKISYTVLDENDSHMILKKCADVILIPCKDLTDDEVALLRRQISYIYDKVSTSYPCNIDDAIKHLSISSKYKTIINNILKEYKNEKKKQNLIDFNDLMIQFCQLLGTKKINTFLENIKYIFFDEYQDINPVQNYILSTFQKSSNCNIMVVGDDAQAIYAFRGSSVQYIWDFEKKYDNIKKFLLETNYRSTPSIVNCFQDIISHNTNQFIKNVKSNQVELGMKPYIICHNTYQEQYKWVADDIAKKYKSGVPLREMVVLSRKNSSLDEVEKELISHSIPVIKSIGISLLNKQHIKDFIAFLTIITNPKSLIHWKRVLALHKNIGTARANEIIDTNDNINEGINEFIIDNPNLNLDSLHKLKTFLSSLKNKQIKEQVQMIQIYLMNLWISNNDNSKNYNMENREKDLLSLLSFMNKQSIEEFISNIHLNLEIDNIEDSLFLSTVHGSKGLEWEYVYIIDMDCKNFPSVRQSYYKDEIDNVMEERRLFYVAASRAKKYLCINFCQDLLNDIVISPFIRELDEKNYIGSNLLKSLLVNYNYTGNVSIDINNYLRFNGYKSLSEMVLLISSIRTNIGYKSDLPAPTTLKNRYIAGNMMDILVSKMIHNNFSEILEHFDLSQNLHNKISEKIYQNYIDRYTDWRTILNDIFNVATIKKSKNCDTSNIDEWKQYLVNDTIIQFYNNVEKCIVKLINSLLNEVNNKIRLHTNITIKQIKGEIDFMVNDTLIEMKTTPDDACTFPNLCQALMYGYLLGKKNITINKIIILNLWDGTIDTFTIDNFNFKKFQKLLYYKQQII
jgi:DNA helicase-2/ATP-dependent DNA helicase PcrA